MTERPDDKPPTVTLRDWLGQISNADPEDLPEGAVEKQVNLHCPRQGILQVRKGLREISFDG